MEQMDSKSRLQVTVLRGTEQAAMDEEMNE